MCCGLFIYFFGLEILNQLNFFSYVLDSIP